jgi:hypothetical protein
MLLRPHRQSATIRLRAGISFPSWSRSTNDPRRRYGPSRYGVTVTAAPPPLCASSVDGIPTSSYYPRWRRRYRDPDEVRVGGDIERRAIRLDPASPSLIRQTVGDDDRPSNVSWPIPGQAFEHGPARPDRRRRWRISPAGGRWASSSDARHGPRLRLNLIELSRDPRAATMVWKCAMVEIGLPAVLSGPAVGRRKAKQIATGLRTGSTAGSGTWSDGLDRPRAQQARRARYTLSDRRPRGKRQSGRRRSGLGAETTVRSTRVSCPAGPFFVSDRDIVDGRIGDGHEADPCLRPLSTSPS